MSVCDECGLNVEIMGTHVMGCSHFVQEDYEKALENADVPGVHAWNAVIESASERGTVVAKSMIKDLLLEHGIVPPADFDPALMDVIKLSSWAGVLSTVQVFTEQEFIDSAAIRDFVGSAPHFEE